MRPRCKVQVSKWLPRKLWLGTFFFLNVHVAEYRCESTGREAGGCTNNADGRKIVDRRKIPHQRRRDYYDSGNDGNVDITDDERRWMIADNRDDARRCGRLRRKGWIGTSNGRAWQVMVLLLVESG